jgi:hypothetical protein
MVLAKALSLFSPESFRKSELSETIDALNKLSAFAIFKAIDFSPVLFDASINKLRLCRS